MKVRRGETAFDHSGVATKSVFSESKPVTESLSIVIPVYNEEDNVGPLVARLREALTGWSGAVEILFVDDGSRDATLELLKEAQRSDPRIRIATFSKNLGQTAAMAVLSALDKWPDLY